MSIDWEVEGEAIEATDEQIKRISILSERQLELEQSILEAEKALEALRDNHRQVAEVDLPMALDEAQVQRIMTNTGRIVSVSEKLYMSIPKIRKEECARWLFENGFGSLVQEDVVIRFERGQERRIAELEELLEGAGYDDWTVREQMNTGSVKAAFSERMENGEDVPLELFGGYLRRAAVVK